MTLWNAGVALASNEIKLAHPAIQRPPQRAHYTARLNIHPNVGKPAARRFRTEATTVPFRGDIRFGFEGVVSPSTVAWATVHAASPNDYGAAAHGADTLALQTLRAERPCMSPSTSGALPADSQDTAGGHGGPDFPYSAVRSQRRWSR